MDFSRIRPFIYSRLKNPNGIPEKISPIRPFMYVTNNLSQNPIERKNTMIQDFLKTVDTTNPAARCGVHELWTKYLAWLPGDQARVARRRIFVTDLREAGLPVGLVGGTMFVGGVNLPTRKRSRGHWVESGGKLALCRERGEAERIECAAKCG
jgi:hypothetical protein